jgi:hypothetical protein
VSVAAALVAAANVSIETLSGGTADEALVVVPVSSQRSPMTVVALVTPTRPSWMSFSCLGTSSNDVCPAKKQVRRVHPQNHGHLFEDACLPIHWYA